MSPFGKYRSYHLFEVAAIDPKYVTWIANKYEEHAYKAKDVSRNWQRPIHRYIRPEHFPHAQSVPVSRFIGTIDEKLNDLHLFPVRRVRTLEDSAKTR